MLWGGRYAPAIAAGEWWRWVSSLLLHQSFSHLLSNMVCADLLPEPHPRESLNPEPRSFSHLLSNMVCERPWGWGSGSRVGGRLVQGKGLGVWVKHGLSKVQVVWFR
jgi:hypothetical protein